MLGELIPCGGGDPIPLLKPRLLIGRRGSCDISLRFPNVSSHHCQMELVNGYWFVRDLGSRNGIKVNGVRCESKWLMPEDVLWVAKHRYEVTYAARGEAPTMDDEDPFEIGLLEKAGLAKNDRDLRPSPSTRSPQDDASKPELPETPNHLDESFPIEWFINDDTDE
jgi:adenylate cyclase